MSAALTYHLPSTDTPRAGNWFMHGPPAPHVRYDSYPAFSFVPGTRGDEEPTRYGDFILDLDYRENVLKAVSEARLVVEHYEAVYSLDPESWQLFLSGGKGVHLVLRAEVACQNLYEAWRVWCNTQGREHPGTQQTFSRDLKTVLPGTKTIQRWFDGRRTRLFTGLGRRVVP